MIGSRELIVSFFLGQNVLQLEEISSVISNGSEDAFSTKFTFLAATAAWTCST